MRIVIGSGARRVGVAVLISVLHGADFIDIEGLTILANREDDGEADGGFGGRDYHHEEGDEMAIDLLPAIRKRDEAEVHGIEHQPDRHEHGDDVAPENKAGDAERKQNRDYGEIPGNGISVHRSSSFLARTIAPRMA